jgi:adenylyl- and sulfurtransferase ThiI
MDIKSLETALKEIEKNVCILENSKFEKERLLIRAGRQVKLNFLNEDLANLFGINEILSVEKFASSDKFCKTVKVIAIPNGLIILKNKHTGGIKK